MEMLGKKSAEEPYRPYTIGVSLAHDPAVCVFENDRLIFAVEENKAAGRKHVYNSIANSYSQAQKHCGFSDGQISKICINFDPSLISVKHSLGVPGFIANSIPYVYLKGTGMVLHHRLLRMLFARDFPVPPRVKFVPHHAAHASEALAFSGFSEAAIFVADGRGERESTSWWEADGGGLHKIKELGPFQSLGYLYLFFTGHLGFRFGDEYKVMGLAAYGRDRYSDLIGEIIWEDEGDIFATYENIAKDRLFIDVMLNVAGVKRGYLKDYPGSRVQQLFGLPRMPGQPLLQKHKDLACSLQASFEKHYLGCISWLHDKTGQRSLCISGGAAMNGVANGKIAKQTGFENVFVSFAPYDAGTAIGAVVHEKRILRLPQDPFLGPEYTNQQILDAIAGLDFEKVDAAEAASDFLSEGKLVAWFQGRTEFGMRALGHRSLLANPGKAATRTVVNEIKGREQFRPLAASVKSGRALKYFESAPCSPFMSFVTRAREEQASRIPAVVHVDGTTRIQTVSEKDGMQYWRLLDKFERKTGLPLVLNTSLNVAGKPIANAPKDAVDFLLSRQIDYLVIGDFCVKK